MSEPEDETDRRFARNFRGARERAGLTQREVADAMREQGIPYHQQTVTRIESGEQPVRLRELVALAAIVGTSLDALVRPAELEMAAADIMSAARTVREQRRELAALTRKHEYDSGRLRAMLEKARENGTAERLRNEIRAGMAALGERPGSDEA